MVINKDIYKRLRLIKATLESGEAGATDINFTIDANAPSGEFPSKDFHCQIEITDSAGAQKTGWKKVYNRSGVSAGILKINKNTLTFATGDVIEIQGTLL